MPSQDAADALGVLVGKTATYSGGSAAFLFGLSANELAAVGGLVIAVIGLCVQWYYNHRRDRREAAIAAQDRAESEARIEHMRASR